MQRLEVSGAVRPIYGSLDVKRLIVYYLPSSAYVYQAAGFPVEGFCAISYVPCMICAPVFFTLTIRSSLYLLTQ